MANKWKTINELPPENELVDTMLTDYDWHLTGPKKHEVLRYRDGKWFNENDEEVDYAPNHWRAKE